VDFGHLAADHLHRITHELDVRAVCALYGVHLDASDMALCPFHSENTASFVYFVGDDEKRRLHCHGCGWSGDVIDFVRAKGGLSYPAAMAECKRLLDSGLEAPPAEDVEAPDFSGTVAEARVAAAADAGPIREMLASRNSPIDLAWLLTEFRLGVAGSEILMPHFAAGEDQPHAVKRRLANGEKRSAKGGRLSQLYGVWRDKNTKDVVLVEGESDTWTVAWDYHRQRVDVFGLPRGVGSSIEPHWLERLRGRRVTLMFDPDHAGRLGLLRWAAALHEVAAELYVAHLPEGTDASRVSQATRERAMRERVQVIDLDNIIRKSRTAYLRITPAEVDANGVEKKPEQATRLTDWKVDVKRRVEVAGERIVFDVQLPNGREVRLSTDDLTDPRKLTVWANRYGLAVKMRGADTQDLLRLLEQEAIFVPRVEGIMLAGWHRGSFVLPEPTGTLGTPAYAYVPPTIDAKWETRLRLASGQPAPQVAQMLSRLHEDKVMTPILGWVAAAPLRALCPQFPTLGVMGSAGAGKTTLVSEVLQTFGFSDGTPVTISNTTQHGVWGMLGSTNSIPVWFDEYRFGAREDGLRALDQGIRDAWNGASSLRGGMGENKSSLTTFSAVAPIIVTGESAFQEQSHAERMVIVTLHRDGRRAEALEALRLLDRAGFGRDYLDWLLWAYERGELEAAPALNDRMEQAVAVVEWGYEILRRFAADRYAVLLPEFDGTIIRAEQTEMAASSPIMEAIREFRGASDNLNGGLVVWTDSGNVCVRYGRLPSLVRQHTTIVLPGNAASIRKWLEERYPGAYEQRDHGRYLVIPGAEADLFGQ
jgi:hypothetical protein